MGQSMLRLSDTMTCARLVVVASVLLVLVSSQSLKPTVQKVSILDLLAESPELKAKLDAKLKEGRTESSKPESKTGPGKVRNSRLPPRLKSHKKPAETTEASVQGAGETVASTTVRNSRRGFRLPSRGGSSQGGVAKASTASEVRRPASRRESRRLSTSSTAKDQRGSSSGSQRNARFGGSRFRSRSRVTTTPATSIDKEEAAPAIDTEGAAVVDAASRTLTTQRPRIRNARLPPGLRRRSRVTTGTTTTSTVSTPVISVVPPIDHIDDMGEVELTTSTTTAKPSRRNGRRFPTLRRRS